MKCSNCSKEIPEGSKYCNFCGQGQDNTVDEPECTVTPIQQKDMPNQQKGAKNIKKILLTVLLLIGAGIAVLCYVSNHFDADEKYALRIVDKYQDMLKDPDSLILRSDVIVIESYTERHGFTTHCFFTASGNNSYGASITSSVCFVDGSYFCDLSDIPDTTELVELAQTDEEKAQEYVHVNLRLAEWNLYGLDCAEDVEDILDVYTVDAEKIARKLKVSANVD